MDKKDNFYFEKLSNGDYLFKFCTFNVNALQILINNTLYFVPPGSLNDPLDCRTDIKIINPEYYSNKTIKTIRESRHYLSEEVKWAIKNVGATFNNEELQEEIFKTYFNFIKDQYFGVCSFSMDFQHNLLWSDYGNEARGILLVFNKEKLKESIIKSLKNKPYRLIANPISYRKPLKKLIVQLYKDGNVAYHVKNFFSKTPHWKHEKEFRFVLEQNGGRFYLLKPEDMLRFISFKPECLEYIIAGERIKSEHWNILRNLFGGEKVLQHSFD